MPLPPRSALLETAKVREPDVPSRITIDGDSVAELASSMASLGLLQPVGVQAIPGTDEYELSYGHRRLLAARFLGWHDIPALILDPTMSKEAARQAENSQRVQLTPVEEARELKPYRDSGETVNQLASRFHRSTSWVAARLQLLSYPPDIQDAIHSAGLPVAVAAQLAQITHPGYRSHLTDEALRNGCSAATAAIWLQHYLADQPRIDANTDTIQGIIERRDEYKVMSPCEYCGDPAELQTTRVWRLCPSCSNGLVAARAGQRS